MKLNQKTQLFVSIMAVLVAVLTVLVALSFRHFSLLMAERHARSVAETVKVGLTESMINGTIDKRQQFLSRLAGVHGVQNVHVMRGPGVVSQFGPGLAREQAVSASERQVLESGKPIFELVEVDGTSYFHGVIPYTASEAGIPNCLQCHQVPVGAVLGAVTVDVPLDEVQRQGIVAVILVGLLTALAAGLSLLLLRRLVRPLAETAEDVQDIMAQAVGGNFGGRIRQRTSDEVGEIAGNINRLMEFLDLEIGAIRSRVGELMWHQTGAAGNQLVQTAEMVEGLVEAAKFKQAIEEDQNKQDIYFRLAAVLKQKYDFHRFSIYEVASSKNRMTPIIVDGEPDASCRWCDPQILVDSSFCRARRTGREVSAVDTPGLCTMFRSDNIDEDTHICLPINQSGNAGCVVQIVMSKEEGPLGKCLTPFIDVYLKEAGPVLEAKRLMEHLRENSMRDAMTGLYNRRFLEEYVAALVSGAQRRKSPFSVLMLDLDYFKQVNDTYGHEAGDKVIKTLADILVRNVRASDLTVRYGGEEFVIVLLDTGAEAAVEVAEKIRTQVGETKMVLPGGGTLVKTISIGVAEFPNDSDTFWQVVKFADVALYKAKETGRNRVIRFNADMWNADERY